MTPSEVETAARSLYNAVNDTFWGQDEIFKLVYQGELILSREALVIEATATATTVAGTQSYAFPLRCIALKRVTYDGNKLQKIDFREDDSLTLSNSATTQTGRPQYYYEWDEFIYLRVIPDSALTLQYFFYQEPAQLNAGATSLSIPSRYHLDLVDYVVSEMNAKDQNLSSSTYYYQRWLAKVASAKRWEAKRKRRDTFSMVKDEESLSQTLLGQI